MATWEVSLIRRDGSIMGIYAPEDLHFVLNIDDPHTIDFNMSIHADEAALFRSDEPACGPYRTDWSLTRDSLEIANGIITRTSGRGEDEYFSISGQSYLHYLDRRVFPYDLYYSNTIGNRVWAAGGYIASETPVNTILEDILLYTDQKDAYGLGFTCNIDAIPFAPLVWQINPADSETILAKVKTFSEAMYGVGSFDFEMTKAKVFRAYAPEKGDHTSPVITLFRDPGNKTTEITSLSYTNDGPIATHVIGTASGGGLPINKDFPESSAAYRRLDVVRDFSQSIKVPDQLDNRVSSEISLDAFPVHEIPITVNANEIAGFWTKVEPGLYIRILYDLRWHIIDSSQKVVSMDCSVTNEGDENVSFGLNQWRDRSGAAGYDNP